MNLLWSLVLGQCIQTIWSLNFEQGCQIILTVSVQTKRVFMPNDWILSQKYSATHFYSASPPPWSNLENSSKLQIQLDLDQTWRQFINRLVACTQRQKYTVTRLDQELTWISPPTHTSGNAGFKTFWYGSNQLVYVCTQTHTSETWSVLC